MMDDPIPALKQRLAQAILEEIGKRNMWLAGRLVGIHQPDMWKLEHGRLQRFSVHKLAYDGECERGVIRDPNGSFDIAFRC